MTEKEGLYRKLSELINFVMLEAKFENTLGNLSEKQESKKACLNYVNKKKTNPEQIDCF